MRGADTAVDGIARRLGSTRRFVLALASTAVGLLATLVLVAACTAQAQAAGLTAGLSASLLLATAGIGLLALFAFALTWLATALGLAAKSVETASNTPMFLTLLVFLGSGFVPAATMPVSVNPRGKPGQPVLVNRNDEK